MLRSEKIIFKKNFMSQNYLFWVYKRSFDLFICTILLPLFVFTTFILIFLNMLYNKGPVFFIQKRMGKNCEPFLAIKFRTMKNSKHINRKFLDPLEKDRITSLGRILRKTKIDELPQILNVFKGDMSLIGPRPDYYEHALSFLETIPYYGLRHSIRPGISGLSQIRLGYAEGLDETKIKSKIDIFYIKNIGLKLDLKIFFGTIFIILKNSIK